MRLNPVTGKKEIQFVSEAQEMKIGEQQYAPTRQSEGGDFDVLPDLTAYVNEVGQKLAAVSDRKLPYEFVVLNNSVPNAWALPGGKIAVNRGLLTELQNEAELAAVLGHEIVHAAARHGAKAQERGTLCRSGWRRPDRRGRRRRRSERRRTLASRAPASGAQLVQKKYGRDQELESDEYGMKYMKLAGYDPWGAVTLQETFVRLSQAERRESSKAASKACSLRIRLRRSASRRTSKPRHELGRGGDLGEERYAARMKPLRAHRSPRTTSTTRRWPPRARKNTPGASSSRSEAAKLRAAGRTLPGVPRRDRARGEAAAEGDRVLSRKRSI